MKIKGYREKCDESGACVKMCPMDIPIPDHIKNRQRVPSMECILCQTCIGVCAKDALRLSFGFGLGNKEVLNKREHSLT